MGGEAGDGVDLIEDDLPIRGEEQIHPGEYPAVQGTVNGFAAAWISAAFSGGMRAGQWMAEVFKVYFSS